jgi:hypothetical protein
MFITQEGTLMEGHPCFLFLSSAVIQIEVRLQEYLCLPLMKMPLLITEQEM